MKCKLNKTGETVITVLTIRLKTKRVIICFLFFMIFSPYFMCYSICLCFELKRFKLLSACIKRVY